MIKSIALIIFLVLAGCAARLEQNFEDAAAEPPAEEPSETPPAVILEGRVVLPEN